MEERTEKSIAYAEPIEVTDPRDCTFYHRMDVPEIGEVGDQWDLRDCVDEYLGNYDFSGKRVLDVGAASGFLTFEMEKRGADVVSFDMESGDHWNIVPHFNRTQVDWEQRKRAAVMGHRKMINGYWLIHRAIGSKAKAFYGDIYDLPEALGPFDVVFFGMILTHLRDPFRALHSGSELSSDTLIITNQVLKAEQPIARFIPSTSGKERRAWWILSDTCVEQMLGVLGFHVEKRVISRPKALVADRRDRDIRCTAFVARRKC